MTKNLVQYMTKIAKGIFILLYIITQLSIQAGAGEQESGDSIKRFTQSFMSSWEKNQRALILSLCSDRWKEDFVMQKHCYEEQVQARERVQEGHSAMDNIVIWANCAGAWSDDSDRTDWVMMEHCLVEQTAAQDFMRTEGDKNSQ